MHTFRLALLVLARMLALPLRRAVRGPLRPSWSFRLEAARLAVRTAIECSQRAGLRWLHEIGEKGKPPAELMRRVRLEAVDADGVPAEWSVVAGAPDSGRVVVFFHGGGYCIGSVASYRETAARLAVATRARVLSVDYRLGLDHAFPAAQDDCLTALRWLAKQGVQPSRTALAGNSAGGGLCLATLLALRDAGEAQPAASLLISPWVDPLARGGSIESNLDADSMTHAFLDACISRFFRSREECADPRVNALRADLRGVAPLFVAVGGAEMLLDQDRAFARGAAGAGVDVELAEYEDMPHLFEGLAGFEPTARRLFDDMARFVEARLAGEQPAGVGR